MILTFIDSGVLVAAARGADPQSERALEVLEDEERLFVSSPFVRLEVLPKAVCYQKKIEEQFYQAFFDSVQCWVNDVEKLVRDAIELPVNTG
jgi:predicted nucleic acid-binding protein